MIIACNPSGKYIQIILIGELTAVKSQYLFLVFNYVNLLFMIFSLFHVSAIPSPLQCLNH